MSGTSLMKKEIRLRRKPKAEKTESAPVAASEPKKDGGTSFMKKEIRLRRKPKAQNTEGANTESANTESASAESASTVTEPKAKRSRPSLPSLSAPKLSLPKASKQSRRHGKIERVVGLKIGGSQIAAACIANNGSAKLERIARVPLASGIVSGGELRDTQALADALRTFFEENDLPRHGVRLGVSSSRIGVRSIELPAIDNETQFLNAIRFRAQEALPIPLDEAVLDYRVLDERQAEDGGQTLRRVLLVVAHRDLVDRYVDACRRAGLTLSGIDLEAFALLRALAPPAQRDESAVVAVSIGYDRTTLAVSDGRHCEFSRVLAWGGAELNAALARALGTSEVEVESVKRSLSLAGGDAPEGLSPEEAATAVDVLNRGIESLVRELVSSLTYYQSQPGSLAIGEIILTGGGAKLAGLPEALERLLGVPVRLGDPLARLEVTGPVDESEIGSLAIAVGLGIED
ncbi:MAG TPA: type IV pilus assembly protein PilM [Gaiellaceae bacterium]|jgi:type IV pilus assembly protein PilM